MRRIVHIGGAIAHNGAMSLLTVGHGRLDRDELGALLTRAEVDLLVDVRRYPASRRNPDVAREVMADWLGQAGVDYRWEERFGGRRHLNKEQRARSPDTWWRVEAFRAYAAHTRSDEFAGAFTDLIAQARRARVAIMCSEAVWWRCHRRLIADVAVLTTDVPVHHLMHDGRLDAHAPSPGARVENGTVVWDGAPPAQSR